MIQSLEEVEEVPHLQIQWKSVEWHLNICKIAKIKDIHNKAYYI